MEHIHIIVSDITRCVASNDHSKDYDNSTNKKVVIIVQIKLSEHYLFVASIVDIIAENQYEQVNYKYFLILVFSSHMISK